MSRRNEKKVLSSVTKSYTQPRPCPAAYMCCVHLLNESCPTRRSVVNRSALLTLNEELGAHSSKPESSVS